MSICFIDLKCPLNVFDSCSLKTFRCRLTVLRLLTVSFRLQSSLFSAHHSYSSHCFVKKIILFLYFKQSFILISLNS